MASKEALCWNICRFLVWFRIAGASYSTSITVPEAPEWWTLEDKPNWTACHYLPSVSCREQRLITARCRDVERRDTSVVNRFCEQFSGFQLLTMFGHVLRLVPASSPFSWAETTSWLKFHDASDSASLKWGMEPSHLPCNAYKILYVYIINIHIIYIYSDCVYINIYIYYIHYLLNIYIHHNHIYIFMYTV